MTMELRCPACHGLLARDFEGKVSLYCQKCKLDVTVSQRPRENRGVVLQMTEKPAIRNP